MDDRARVRVAERVAELDRDVEDPSLRERSVLQDARQRRAVEELHDEVARPPAALFDGPEVADVADVGAPDRARRLRFADEARRCIRLARHRSAEHLDRHRAIEHRVAGPVDDPHPSAPELGLDDVAPIDRAPDEGVDDGRAANNQLEVRVGVHTVHQTVSRRKSFGRGCGFRAGFPRAAFGSVASTVAEGLDPREAGRPRTPGSGRSGSGPCRTSSARPGWSR